MTSGDTIYASEHEQQQQQQQQQHQTSEQEQHDRFISALERYGPQTTGWEWENMATATGWTVDEVKLYAYRYMISLNAVSNHNAPSSAAAVTEENYSAEKSGQINSHALIDSNKDGINIISEGPNDETNKEEDDCDDDDEWTFEECVLFDTLLARYADNTKNESNEGGEEDISGDGVSRWEQISALLPNKTSLQVRNRYVKISRVEKEKRRLAHQPTVNS